MLYFFNGFEANHAGTNPVGIQNNSGTWSIVATHPRSGGYELRVNPTTTAVGWVQFSGVGIGTGGFAATVITVSPLVAGFGFYAATLPAANSEEIIAFYTSPATLIATVRIKSDGKLAMYNSDGTTQTGSDSTNALVTGGYYYIEVSVSHGAAGSCVGSVTVYDSSGNGTTEITTNTGTFTTAAANLDLVRFGKVTNRNGQSVDFFYDDCYIGDTALGPVKIAQILANGDGTYTAFTGGTNASDYQEYDEASPDDAATYAQSTGTSTAETGTLQSCADAGCSGAATYHSVIAVHRCGRAGVGATRQIRARSGTTDVDNTTAQSIGGANYENMYLVFDTDPNTTVAWTESGIDALQVGAVEGSAATNRVRLTWIAGWILYTPAVAAAGHPAIRRLGQITRGISIPERRLSVRIN